MAVDEECGRIPIFFLLGSKKGLSGLIRSSGHCERFTTNDSPMELIFRHGYQC